MLTALDDKDYTLAAGMVVISDDSGVESVAGIMGGAGDGLHRGDDGCVSGGRGLGHAVDRRDGAAVEGEFRRAISQRARH